MAIHYDKTSSEIPEHVVVMTIDRPETKNALDLYHFRDLKAAWRDFKNDDDLWVAIVTGVDIRVATSNASFGVMEPKRG